MRIWMEILVEIHDRKAYKSVWEEVQRPVLELTRKPLKLKGLHKGDTFVSTINIEDLIYFSGIPKPLHLSNETRKHIFDLKYAKTVEEVEAFKPWISILLDPDGVLKPPTVGWWNHRLMHRWLLRGIIQCLSNIPLEQWSTMRRAGHAKPMV
ncbi:hypothetical protein B0H14DRAFT_2574341 [Mycena olivaceomarginata]|nr:hypothetical protein B0H14DRAFT_2574341 [Mycena olivaceomarginata]